MQTYLSYFKQLFLLYRYSILVIISCLLIWQVLSDKEIVNPHFIPSPATILKAEIEWIKTGEFLIDLQASLWRGGIGFVLGVSIGVLLGIFTGRISFLDQTLSPIMNVLRSFPPVSLLPVFITLFGIGDSSKVFSIAFAVLFPVWINAHIGSANIPTEYLRSARLMSDSRLAIFAKIVIPSAMRWIVGGIRLGISMTFIMLYVSELAGASTGLGYRISAAHLAYRTDTMFAALFTLGLLSAGADMLFRYFSFNIFPYLKLS